MSYAPSLCSIVAAIIGAVRLLVSCATTLTPVDVAMLLLLGVVVVVGALPPRTRAAGVPAQHRGLRLPLRPARTTPSRFTTSAYLLTFAVMLVVALTMSRLTGADPGARRSRASGAGRRAAAMAAMTTELAGAEQLGCRARLAGAARQPSRAGEACAADGRSSSTRSAGEWEPGRPRAARQRCPRAAAARRAHGDGAPAGAGTRRCADADVLVVPLRAGRQEPRRGRRSAGAGRPACPHRPRSRPRRRSPPRERSPSNAPCWPSRTSRHVRRRRPSASAPRC